MICSKPPGHLVADCDSGLLTSLHSDLKLEAVERRTAGHSRRKDGPCWPGSPAQERSPMCPGQGLEPEPGTSSGASAGRGSCCLATGSGLYLAQREIWCRDTTPSEESISGCSRC